MRSKVEMMVENININQNVLACAHEVGADRVVSMTSTCVFPDKARAPPVLAAPRRTAPTRAAPPPPPPSNALRPRVSRTRAQIAYPITEDTLHDGPPHPSNEGYAYAKRMVEARPPPPSHPSY